jgi:cytochrome P450 PksS
VVAVSFPRFAHNRRTVTNEPSALDRWYVPKLIRAFQSNMLASDPPDHRRLRTLVQKAFTPGRVEEIRDSVVRVVTELLDAAEKKERVDLIADFALPLPLTIISMMMGVPEEDRFKFHHWTAELLDASTASPLKMLGQFANAYKLQRFFRKLIQMRREQPSDDLLTALVQAEEQGDRLSEEELVSMIFLILLAGHETTVNLIGNGVLALLQHPDQLQKLREDPELIVPGIEELLRFGNAVEQSAVHFAKEDITLHGELIPRGGMVLLLISSANRDERAFPNPDQLDLARTPNRHLGLGMGAHFCLGAPLARMEGRIAIQTLVNRFPRVRLAIPEDELQWRSSITLRGLKALPVHLS